MHERIERMLVALVGEFRFSRTGFPDEYGLLRTLADELLGIPKRARLSAGAFLWIVLRAADELYRKTAEAFASLSGCAISHVSAMNCVHAEGELLKAADVPLGRKISQDTLSLEADGLWAHVQKHGYREALPRFLCEQAERMTSFELKIGAVHVGERKATAGRFAFAGLAPKCLQGDAEEFWQSAFHLVVAHVFHQMQVTRGSSCRGSSNNGRNPPWRAERNSVVRHLSSAQRFPRSRRCPSR